MKEKPSERPLNPRFSSGPCSKRPGWSLDSLGSCWHGRSHRAKGGKAKLAEVIEKSRKILGIPEDYRVGIVPASDTGAVEMALWSLLGPRGVDMLSWESFGKGWVTDVIKQLKLNDVRTFEADYGKLPDLSQVSWDRDVVFTWNGTTSGVRVPNGEWISSDRAGLSICDATSAAFAMPLPWDKLDVTTWSWQKVLGGEGAHGMIALSPRAVERLESHEPSWPMPKIFRLTKGGKLNESIFTGATINTPSMLCVEDALDSLGWAESVGGLEGLVGRCDASFAVISDWVSKSDWAAFLAEDTSTSSTTSVCLKVTADWFTALSDDAQAKAAKRLAVLLEEENAALDIGAYRDAPAGLRIWGGATVETSDIELLLPWLDWAIEQVRTEFE